MIRFVPKIKAGEDSHSYRVRMGMTAGMVGLFTNLFLFVIKITVGLFVNSLSVIGEAINSLSDSGSALITLLGMWFSNKPSDKEHPFGHARAEYMFSLIVAMIIIYIGISLGRESIDRIKNPLEVKFYLWTFVVLLISVVVKIFLAIFYNNLGDAIKSSILKAQAIDSRSDILSTSVVFIGMIAQNFTTLPVDGVLGLVVAGFICYSGYDILREHIDNLLGVSIDEEDKKEIVDLIFEEKKVLGIHDLIVHDYGPTNRFASVHVEVNANEDFLEINNVIDDIETKAFDELGLQLTIHTDPIVVGDERKDLMEERLSEIINAIDKRLSFHDFRIVKSNGRDNLIFDVVMHEEVSLDKKEINQIIQKELKIIDPKCYATITFDQDYFRSTTYSEEDI